MTKASKNNSTWRSGKRYSHYRVMAPERHLIVCEGQQTEPRYFKGMQDALKHEFRQRIHISIKGTGKHTTDLLEFAINECKGNEPFDHVWLVYDKDDFSDEEFDKVEEFCSEEKFGNANFHALWSNPCFELWLLLHFQYTTAQMDATQVYKKVDTEFKKQFGASYLKNANDHFGKLRSLLPGAKQNARQLHEQHREDEAAKPSAMNPCTKVFELLDELEGYLEGGGDD